MEDRLQVIMGCMQSGKSTELRRRLSRYMSYRDDILVVNSALDTRDKRDTLSTHDKTVTVNLPAIKVAKLTDILSSPKYTTSHVIGIDEAQFFEDLLIFVKYSLRQNKIIIVAGLDSDYNAKKFGQILELVPFATSVIKLNACCSLCGDGTLATFSHRTVDVSHEAVQVGGSESYAPVCMKHFLELNPEAFKPDDACL